MIKDSWQYQQICAQMYSLMEREDLDTVERVIVWRIIGIYLFSNKGEKGSVESYRSMIAYLIRAP